MTPNPQKHQRDYCITMTEWNEFRKLKAKDYQSQMRVPNIVDARRLYDPQDFKDVNFVAIGLGAELPPANPPTFLERRDSTHTCQKTQSTF